ncbi:trypsin-like peptidase domain-containing protein [Paenibacillus sp. JX-17]|uniref:Trypsin-like peptidase domain-containing protein n=1 Tax=Paenibacillus lacisoli TaxID=3064525 RepID=A0ABT9CDM1_9BACL|nr:trypsin-like peptidase domain-containing protein [Paenibacillus sp. JX-17]MDO7907364.1 trypsin-like peptidase domain-containing protein [Paenibacillus sp. JX-17]
MDDNKQFGRREDEKDQAAGQQSSEKNKNSSYYYSYGPFSSINNNEAGRTSSGENGYGRQEGEVEVTEPQQVKPIPAAYQSNPVPQPASSNSGGASGKNWQYNQKPKKSSFRTAFFSFIAGMIVITVLMYTADRTNLFTPDAALNQNQSAAATTASGEGSGSNDNNGSGSSGVVPAVMPSGSADVQSVVKKAGPAVVKISTLSKSGGSSSNGGNSGNSGNSYFNDPLYQYFFGGSGDGSSNNGGNDSGSSGSGKLTPLGIGSGFIFDKSGYILTNNHVIEGADVIQVTVENMNNNRPYEAKLLGHSADLDLAVLKIEGNNDFPIVSLGNSDNAQVGEWMVAIGNPEGFEHSVTAGVLSAKEREITINSESTGQPTQYKHLIQTDASINPGNSGGPLLNLNGEVIGMNVAVSADAQGIGFAIPANTISSVLDKLKNNQEIPKEPVPFIGATLGDMSPQVAQELGTTLTEGAYVNQVMFKSPAYQADLRQYDIITGINGTKYATSQELIAFIQKQKVGDTITLNVNRDGKNLDLKVKLGDRNQFASSQQGQSQDSSQR